MFRLKLPNNTSDSINQFAQVNKIIDSIKFIPANLAPPPKVPSFMQFQAANQINHDWIKRTICSSNLDIGGLTAEVNPSHVDAGGIEMQKLSHFKLKAINL